MSLREIVAAQAPTAEELPLVHTTRCEVLPHIIANNELRCVNECDVFHENLIYFFYGRPAFKHETGDEPAAVIDPCPVCFVFKRQTIGNASKRVFACDTGAIHYGIFENLLYRADRDAMELYSNIQSARQLVSWMFGGNSKYLIGDAIDPAPPEAVAGSLVARYYELLTSPVALKKKPDDRRSAIEVQLESPVGVNDRLDYVILPGEKLGEAGVREKIVNDWNAKPIPYDYIRHRPPGEYRTLFYELLKPEFQRDGLL